MTQALGFFADRGITVERVLTDNGSCYRSRCFARVLAEAGIGHRRTRPYRPQTNGKVERFNLTLKWEWAYAKPLRDQRLTHRGARPMAPSLQLPSTSYGPFRQGAHHGREQRPEEAHLVGARLKQRARRAAPRHAGRMAALEAELRGHDGAMIACPSGFGLRGS